MSLVSKLPICTILLFSSVVSEAAELRPERCQDTAIVSSLLEIQRLLYNDRFEAADSLAGALVQRHPEHPAGYLFQAVGLITQMFDREDRLDCDRFHRLLDSSRAKAVTARDTTSGSARAWMCLYLGHAAAYRSLWESRFGSLLKAIRLGRRARSEYEEGLVHDSNLYDLYFGLGLVHYWKSARAGILRRLGIIRNEKDRGVAELRLAADSALISGEAARNALVWVWLDLKEYDSVVAYCRQMMAAYPDGKAFLWPLGRAYSETKDYRRAQQTFQKLRDRIALQPGNYYNLIECDFYLYRCLTRIGIKDRARDVAEQVSEYYDQIPTETRRRQRTKLAFLRRAAGT